MLLLYLSLIPDEKDKSKLALIYEKYFDIMLKQAYDITHDRANAEDAVHNTFLYYARNPDSIPDPNDSKAVYSLLTVVKYRTIDMYRKESKIHKAEFAATLINEDSCTDDVLYSVLTKEKYDQIIAVLESLPERYFAPLFLYYVNGEKPAQISKKLGMKLNTVKTNLRKGKALLYEKLEENFEDYDY